MEKLAVEDNIIPVNINPNNDAVVSTDTGWTSAHIKDELDKKTSKTESSAISRRIDLDYAEQTTKADLSALGTQAIFELRGNDLYITTL